MTKIMRHIHDQLQHSHLLLTVNSQQPSLPLMSEAGSGAGKGGYGRERETASESQLAKLAGFGASRSRRRFVEAGKLQQKQQKRQRQQYALSLSLPLSVCLIHSSMHWIACGRLRLNVATAAVAFLLALAGRSDSLLVAAQQHWLGRCSVSLITVTSVRWRLHNSAQLGSTRLGLAHAELQLQFATATSR